MKVKKNLILSSLMLIMLAISINTHAQEKEDAAEKYTSHLTAEQKKLLKEQQALKDKNRTIFKENLTKKQLAILNDRAISKDRRTKLLRQSLSQKQRDQIRLNRDLLKTKRDFFRNSLARKQKLRLRRLLHDRKGDDRRRLVRRLRRLIRDNTSTTDSNN